jgi:beta-glucosidase
MRVLVKLTILIAIVCLPVAGQQPVPRYKDSKVSIEDRLADLLPRMTLEQKVGQITGGQDEEQGLLDITGKLPYKTVEDVFKEMYKVDTKMGPRERAMAHNALQRYQMEKTKLGIPNLFFGEALHGFMAYGSTSFPQAIGLASTWDPALVKKVFTAASDEMSASGVNQAFTPVLDLARDPRWGRTEETYGEDPYLGSRIGVAAVQGLQGDTFLIDRHHVMATAKHFTAHGQPESGTNPAPADFSERVLRESYLYAFEAAIREGHAGSVKAMKLPSFYIHQKVSSVTRPVLELRGFERVHVRPGEKISVTFSLDPGKLAILDEMMRPVVEPGTFEILVGNSSTHTQSAQLQVR